jgi:hypothetical protein
VSSVNGETRIGHVNKEDRTSIRDRLYTAGELLRMNQLTPDQDKTDSTDNLFEDRKP